MRPRLTRMAALALALAVVCSLPIGSQALAGQRYELTITNLTRTQIFSPPVAVTHAPSIRLFTPGMPASPELAALAEDADASGLLALVSTLPQVADYTIGDGPIPPGGEATLTIETRGKRRQLSVVGMLVTTNDAFYSAGGLLDGYGMLRGVAYDSGSEENTESCAHIPGPPCGSGGVRVTENAEGFVHVHAGFHGSQDLADRGYDWRNPVVRVVVRELDDEDEDEDSDD